MRFLLDANCWMEVIRSRPNELDVRTVLSTVPTTDLFITDFAIHTIGVAMRRHKVLDAYPAFIQQAGIGRLIQIVPLAVTQMAQVSTPEPQTMQLVKAP